MCTAPPTACITPPIMDGWAMLEGKTEVKLKSAVLLNFEPTLVVSSSICANVNLQKCSCMVVLINILWRYLIVK